MPPRRAGRCGRRRRSPRPAVGGFAGYRRRPPRPRPAGRPAARMRSGLGGSAATCCHSSCYTAGWPRRRGRGRGLRPLVCPGAGPPSTAFSPLQASAQGRSPRERMGPDLSGEGEGQLVDSAREEVGVPELDSTATCGASWRSSRQKSRLFRWIGAAFQSGAMVNRLFHGGNGNSRVLAFWKRHSH